MKNLGIIIGIAMVLAMGATAWGQGSLTDGLVAYYPFNGNVSDVSGNGNNGTNYGVTFTTDRFGNSNSACNFASSQQQYIALPLLTNLIGSSFATYSFWLYMATNTDGFLVGGWANNGGLNNQDLGFYTALTSGGLITACNNSGTGGGISANPVTNGWHQVVVVLNGTNNAAADQLEFYFDGQSVGGNYGIVNGTVGNASSFHIGLQDGGYGYFNGVMDDVRIYNRALSSNDVAALYANEASTNPPSISTNPVDFYATGNQPASFNVTAYGSGTLNYQWRFNGTNLLSGPNSALNIAVVKPANIGQYDVVITNSFGSVTSSVANLYMYPYLNQPFAGVDTYWGQSNSLSVGAWGSGVLNYQWYFNGAAVAGATNAILSLGAIQFTNAGQYSVVVSSTLGSVTNAPYSVVVNPANVSLAITPTVVIQGTVGYNYTIQSTTNLADTNSWVTETNLTLNQPIQNWYDANVDTSKPGHPQKFYQVLPGQ